MKNIDARQRQSVGNNTSRKGGGARSEESEAPESRHHTSASPLLLKVKEVTRLLGGVHPRTLARLEKRGLIRPVTGLLRHKLYFHRDVVALVENLSSWKP